MQRIVNGVAQQVLGTCRCPQCTPRHVGNAVKSFHSGVAPRRLITGSTIFASAGFAIASSMELGMKQQRRNQWDSALADMSDRVAAKTLSNDRWQQRIGVDDDTIAEHLRRDEEHGYLFGESYDDEPTERESRESITTVHNTEKHEENEITRRKSFYPWRPPEVVVTYPQAKDTTTDGMIHDPFLDEYIETNDLQARDTTADGMIHGPSFDDDDEARAMFGYNPADIFGHTQEEPEIAMLHEEYSVPGEPDIRPRPDADLLRAVAIREAYGADLHGDGALDYYQQLNARSTADVDPKSDNFRDIVGKNIAMANILARTDNIYTKSVVRVHHPYNIAPDPMSMQDLKAGLPDLVASPSLLDVATLHEPWPVNTGREIPHWRLPVRSIYRRRQEEHHRLMRELTLEPTKAEKVRISMNRLESLLLEVLRGSLYLVEDSAFTPNVQDVIQTYKRAIRHAEMANLGRDFQRMTSTGYQVANYWQREQDVPLSKYNVENDMLRPLKLHEQLRNVFRNCKPDMESRVHTLSSIFDTLTATKIMPELHTFEILIAGFSDCGFRVLANNAILQLRRCKLNPNEATLAVILGHHARYYDAERFEHWLRVMFGQHGALAYGHFDYVNEPELQERWAMQERLTGDDRGNIAIVPPPNPKIFSAIIKGTLRLYGLEEALDRATRWAEHGWGLCMDSLTAMVKAAAQAGDVSTAVQMWTVADGLFERTRSNHKVEAVPESLTTSILQLVEEHGDHDAYQLIDSKTSAMREFVHKYGTQHPETIWDTDADTDTTIAPVTSTSSGTQYTPAWQSSVTEDAEPKFVESNVGSGQPDEDLTPFSWDIAWPTDDSETDRPLDHAASPTYSKGGSVPMDRQLQDDKTRPRFDLASLPPIREKDQTRLVIRYGSFSSAEPSIDDALKLFAEPSAVYDLDLSADTAAATSYEEERTSQSPNVAGFPLFVNEDEARPVIRRKASGTFTRPSTVRDPNSSADTATPSHFKLTWAPTSRRPRKIDHQPDDQALSTSAADLTVTRTPGVKRLSVSLPNGT